MASFSTLSDWLAYLATIHTTSINLGLERILPIAQQLGVTHFACPVITVAGTNGKGSTVRALEALLIAADYKKVFAYTSPHLLHFNERLRMNTQPVDDQSLIQAFAKIETLRNSQELSFFEFTTLAILDICKQQQPDALILEVGLGGRLDAVNVVESDVAVITHIAYDHQQWLGETLEQIGFEKAGIMRRGKVAICGDTEPPQSILQQAEKIGALLYRARQDFSYQEEKNTWNWQGFGKNWQQLPYPALKISNVACALAALQGVFINLTLEQVHSALQGLNLTGRQQWIKLPHYPHICLDVAHNPDSAEALAAMLKKQNHRGKIFAVCAMLEDKDHTGTLAPLLPLVEQWFVADLDCIRGGKAQLLTPILAHHNAPFRAFPTVQAALNEVESQAKSNDIILVYGSFHTVAEALKKWPV